MTLQEIQNEREKFLFLKTKLLIAFSDLEKSNQFSEQDFLIIKEINSKTDNFIFKSRFTLKPKILHLIGIIVFLSMFPSVFYGVGYMESMNPYSPSYSLVSMIQLGGNDVLFRQIILFYIVGLFGLFLRVLFSFKNLTYNSFNKKLSQEEKNKLLEKIDQHIMFLENKVLSMDIIDNDENIFKEETQLLS